MNEAKRSGTEHARARLVMPLNETPPSDTLRRRSTFALALAAHALALIALFVLTSSAGSPSTSTRPEEDDPIEIALEPALSVEGEVTSEGPLASSASEAPRAARQAGRTPTREANAPTHDDVASEVPEPLQPPPGAPASATPFSLVPPSPGALGVAGATGQNPLLLAGGAPGDAAGGSPEPGGGRATSRPAPKSRDEAARAAERSIKDALRERDIGLGLGPEGPVLTALSEATYASAAPSGSAVFAIALDAQGAVASLRLVSSTGGENAWTDVGREAARRLAAKRASMRGARGAELRVQIDSRIALPSGASAPIKPALSASKVAIHGGGPPLPSDTVRTYTVAEGDLSDVGAKPRHVVHAKLLDARFF